ncbi:LysM peptidoglycan-binding domain-containing protein [Desulfurobacterium thermolithotrophum]|uniref:M23 family metallopeptidase n=1 Tax=Desulfurobacterium thermolithotrophum TaxID=64160 RepID=UPI0013D2E67F|nr:M23 family metallopeptidase [Desulfurobacterium thermolithotrophum]
MQILILFISFLFLTNFAFADITYVVKRGDSIAKIAKNYGVSVKDIIKANNLKRPYIIRVGQKLKIPTKSRRIERKFVYYTVKKGDSLSKIAKRFRTSIKKLIKINNLKKPYIIRPGQKLKVPVKKSYLVKRNLKKKSSKKKKNSQFVYKSSLLSKVPVYKYYRVRKGDSVLKIAKKFRVSPRTIIRENHLRKPYILRPGQKLKILTGYKDVLKLNRPIQFRFPLDGRIDPTVREKGYPGIFILSNPGKKVKAAETGIVKFAGKDEHFLKPYGNVVIIEHPKGYQTVYSNLNKIFVKPKQIVKRGDVIGTAGISGDWGKSGIYFEINKIYNRKIYQINPLEVLK